MKKVRMTKEQKLPLGMILERIRGDEGYKPAWLGIRRCEGNPKAYVAETLREDGTPLGLGFTSFSASSVDDLLKTIKLLWGECCVIMDLFVWQEEHAYAGDGI